MYNTPVIEIRLADSIINRFSNLLMNLRICYGSIISPLRIVD